MTSTLMKDYLQAPYTFHIYSGKKTNHMIHIKLHPKDSEILKVKQVET